MKKLLSLLVAALMITASSCAMKDQPGAGPATDGTESALPETTDAATSAPETTEPGTGEPATEAVTEAPAGLEETLKQATRISVTTRITRIKIPAPCLTVTPSAWRSYMKKTVQSFFTAAEASRLRRPATPS